MKQKMTRTKLSLALAAWTLFIGSAWGQEAKKLQKLWIGIPTRSMSSFPQMVAVRVERSYRIRLNHRRESSAETSAVIAAAAANRAVISMSFFSSKIREFRDS